MKIHIGPGSNWYSYCNKNNIIDWKTIDIDPKRGNFTVNFNKNFNKLPFKSDSIDAMYASHIFEHISVYVTPILFKECYRVLKKGGYLRIITPNPLISMKEYLNNNTDFPLFKRRKQRNPQFTLFECLR